MQRMYIDTGGDETTITDGIDTCNACDLPVYRIIPFTTSLSLVLIDTNPFS